MSAASLFAARYCVVEEWPDGLTQAWGPFSEHRALMAADALREAAGEIRAVHVLPLHTSTALSRELPDWTREPVV